MTPIISQREHRIMVFVLEEVDGEEEGSGRKYG
jgi:hypothetical protein